MIDLTPLEVRKKKGDFKKTMRGYDPALVDDFLDLVADRLDQLVRENITLTERLGRLEHQVSDNRDRERALTDALVTAQEMREEVRQQTAREAEITRRTAEQEAAQIRADAMQAREREEEVLRRLRARQQQLLQSYRTFLAREMAELQVIGETLEIEGLSTIDAPADSRAHRPSRNRPAAETRPASETRPAAESRPAAELRTAAPPRSTAVPSPASAAPAAASSLESSVSAASFAGPSFRAPTESAAGRSSIAPVAPIAPVASVGPVTPAELIADLTFVAPVPLLADLTVVAVGPPAADLPAVTPRLTSPAPDMLFGDADPPSARDAAEEEEAGMRMLDTPIAPDPQINLLDHVSVMGALEIAILDDDEPFAPEPVDDDEWNGGEGRTEGSDPPRDAAPRHDIQEMETGAPDHDATILLENALRAGYRLDLDDDLDDIGADGEIGEVELLLDEPYELDEAEGNEEVLPHDWLDKMIDDEERDH